MSYPSDLRYTKDHIWFKENGETFLIGVTDYAQDQLGEVLYVDLPAAGTVDAEGTIFEIESSKSATVMQIPFAVEVVAANEELDDDPENINNAPYDTWIAEVKADEADVAGLLSAADYEATL
ncbi:MAG: glycine cleavage system protein GcvH [Eubacteriaceae bacterium]|nr:glycine cleavage system protein GcvH [Eubacteriaceae bacterium]